MMPSTKQKFPPEFQILIHGLGFGVSGREKDPDKAVLKAVDWNRFLRLATGQHRVLGHLGKALAHCRFLPDKVVAGIRQQNRRAGMRMMALTAELLRLADLFQEAGIAALPYKGPVLSMQLYGDVTTRLCNDLDIIVPKSSVLEARDLLLDSGYELVIPSYKLSHTFTKRFLVRNHHFNLRHPQKGILVELHWKFFSDISPVSFETTWKNRQAVSIAGRRVPGIAPEDMLILLLVHGGKHGWSQLFWLYDIVTILKDYGPEDWERLIERAGELGILRPAGFAFAAAALYFNLPLPPAAKTLIRRDRRIKTLIRVSREKLLFPERSDLFPTPYRHALLSYLYFMPGVRYTVKRFSRWLFFWEFEFLPLPGRLSFLYYPLRFHLYFFRRFLQLKPASRPQERR